MARLAGGHDPGRSTFVLFGLGQCARSLLWSTVDLLIGFHLIERAGLSGATAGAVLLGTVIVSAFPDLFIADWLARRRNPLAGALRLQAGAGGLALVFALLLFGPKPEGTTPAILYICLMSMAFRFTYAAYDVSQNALLSLLPPDADGVRRYVTNKTVMTSVGRVLASVLVYAALLTPDDALADMKLLGLTALPVLASVFGLARASSATGRATVLAGGPNWRTLPYRRLAMPILATLCQYGLLSAVARLLPLHPGAPGSGLAGSLVLSMVVGTVIGPMAAHGAVWRGPPGLIAGVFALMGVTAGVALILPLPSAHLMALALLYGLATSALANLIWDRVGAVVFDHAKATGQRIDAPAFALLTTAIKLAIAVSAGLFGVLADTYRSGGISGKWGIAAVLAVGGLGAWVALSRDSGRARISAPAPSSQS
ncbi:MFS transporter [Caulobacter sp. RHG1]|uniref:MFS transporter n=1 Tax=Caulobacter sp. (strain RHG1) TaxID=2545762 RepID=UPI001556A529|nr:MFS transporter [Caulobacter sp. RHG1]NQE61643.1 hypothetical protein [Caulobacter sp. RHG1]